MSFGYHIGKKQSFFKSIKDAYEKEDGTSAYQMFLKSPQRRALSKITDIDKSETLKYVKKHKIKLFIHSGYLFNIGNTPTEYSISTGVDDIMTGAAIGAIGVVFHVGKHCKRCSELETMNIMIEYINEVIDKTKSVKTKFLLETASGAGTEVAIKLDDLKYIFDHVNIKSRFGFCIDTCHIFAAGYDIKDKPDLFITQFNKIIGLKKVKLIHLNDSKGKLDSHLDRHRNMLDGTIGDKGLSTFIKRFYGLRIPIVLETPRDKTEEDLNYIKKNIDNIQTI